MSNDMLCLLDFARYQRWLDRAAGKQLDFLVFSKAGEAVWGDRHAQAAMLGAAIAAAGDVAEGVHRLAWGDGRVALYKSLVMPGVGQMGWSAILVDAFDDQAAPVGLDQVVEAFDDLTVGIADEFRQKSELQSMTEELGSRYEELHLVYSVDRHVQAQSQKQDGVFHDLLQAAAEHLNADVVAYVRPSKDICQFATSLSKEIHNLDLVLVEMRGDLFRFVQASGQSLVINDAERSAARLHLHRHALQDPGVPGTSRGQGGFARGAAEPRCTRRDFSNSDRNLTEVLANQLSSLSNMHLLLAGDARIQPAAGHDAHRGGRGEGPVHPRPQRSRPPSVDGDRQGHGAAARTSSTTCIGAPCCMTSARSASPMRCCASRPGSTKDEYTFIKVHPERSYEILRHVKHLEKAVLGARHHQEMYDGKGYPHGLKGTSDSRCMGASSRWPIPTTPSPARAPIAPGAATKWR